MSHPNSTYDPTEETVKLIVVCECKEEPLDDCLDCDGTGFISISAHVYGGEVYEEVEKLCQCQLN